MATNTILSKETMKLTRAGARLATLAEKPERQDAPPGEPDADLWRWQAVLERDGASDGAFVFAVSSTGIFCRPSCPARRPRRENVRFFAGAEQAEREGYRACLRCRPRAIQGNPQMALVRAVCRSIERRMVDPHSEGQPTLTALAQEFGRSSFHLQRIFKAVLGVSPKAYMDACRLRQVKKNLQSGQSVTDALYAAGYGSSSRLYERTAAQLGMTPDKYRRGAVAAVVRYTISSSPLGRMLIAATDKGICSIQFADSDQALQQGLMREFPFAARRRDDAAMAAWGDRLSSLIRGKGTDSALPLDIRATAFQRRVWECLQAIPRGETRSYSAVARTIGMPRAARAVARACATNPVAVAIPCHRVVREDGERGGYRWGIERKERLLRLEKQLLPGARAGV